jgi:hypothetical protein
LSLAYKLHYITIKRKDRKMSLYSFFSFAISILCIYLGIKSIKTDIKNKFNVLFGLLCFSMMIFCLTAGFAFSVNDKEEIFMLSRIAYIGVFSFLPINLHFFLILNKSKMRSRLLILIYIPALILNIANLSGHLIFSDFVK